MPCHRQNYARKSAHVEILNRLLTFFPSIALAESIQRSLSVSTDDYIPFGCNFIVAAAAFAVICMIYLGVTAMFNFGINRVAAKGEIADVVYAE